LERSLNNNNYEAVLNNAPPPNSSYFIFKSKFLSGGSIPFLVFKFYVLDTSMDYITQSFIRPTKGFFLFF
jgi:hypothetical protein